MPDSARFALHRPEYLGALLRGEDKIAALMSGSAVRLPAGTTLIEAKSEHPFVYRLLEGWAARTRTLSDGRSQCILIFMPGDLFAVKSMFITCHSDAVQLFSDSLIERLHYQDLYRAYADDGDVASRCLWQVMEEERRLHDWVVGLGQGTAEERLALLLIDFHGRLALSGHIAREASTFPMPLTQTQLADHLGLTAVHLNRVLRGLRESGIVSVRDGHVSIGDMQALVRCAYPLLDEYERRTPEYTRAGLGSAGERS